MLRRVTTAALLLASTAAGGVPTSAQPTAGHELRVHVGGRTATIAPDPGGFPTAPTVLVNRRVVVTFTVDRKTVALPITAGLPAAAGSYVAYYLPKIEQGWALAADPGSTEHWPAMLWFGAGSGFATLTPGRMYTLDLATDRPARVPLPFPARVVRVRAASFTAQLSTKNVGLPIPAPIAAGSMPDTVSKLPLTSTAIALDWATSPSPVDSSSGDACPNTAPIGPCPGDAEMTYTDETFLLGPIGGPQQIVFGEAFSHHEPGTVVSGYGIGLPVPFDAATLYAFGIDPPR